MKLTNNYDLFIINNTVEETARALQKSTMYSVFVCYAALLSNEAYLVLNIPKV